MTLYQFFSAPRETYGNALLNWASRPARDLISYAGSYRSSAMNLVAFREQSGVGDIDYSALPILFLYRHSFELYLKAIVFRAAILSINEEELQSALPRLWQEHSLLALTEMAKPVFVSSLVRPHPDMGGLEESIRNLATEIDKVDSGSYSFRYPVTSRGQSALPARFLTNIFVFSEYVERVLDDVAQFCGSLEDERIQTSDQMKFALHSLARART